MSNASGMPQPEKRAKPDGEIDLGPADVVRSDDEDAEWLSARTRELMAERDLKWSRAWHQAERDLLSATGRTPPKLAPRTTSKWLRLALGAAGLGVVALAVVAALATGSDNDPLIPQDRVSQLFEDSVASATALLGERDAQVSEAYEWHESLIYGCEYARYARWSLTDYAAGDEALREIAGLGAEAGLKVFASDAEDGFHWLDEDGTARWDNNSEPHRRVVGDRYTAPITEHHLVAQTLTMGVRPDGTVPWPGPLSFYSIADAPIGPDWFELNVCRREQSD